MSSEQLSIPGIPPVDPRREEWRAHTAENWRKEDPTSYAECIECVKRGELNKSKLARKFGRSRNSILALIMEEFTVEQLQQINGMRAAMAVGEAVGRADELVDEVDAEGIGALAMVFKQASDIAQVTSGGPTEIREERHVLSVEEFQVLAEGTGLEAGKKGAIEAVEVPLQPKLPESCHPVSDGKPLDREGVIHSSLASCIAFMLAFMPVVGRGLVVGSNRGGGGGEVGAAARPPIQNAEQNFSAMGD